ncbi:TetR/AcrR family transcriptional regulator [Romboutsia sp.]|uniref:TetR/AcrR family transcriptional regulator n=1 Tax=Romboutsia sp. TaxID=1965302 RepID=UPI002CDBEEC5|nr:TetR/AcrR family transcriptional regulator [Romboutsia sp.]HSQ90144.1 TetR/AcrR family transcriptional regulator [Romboutsia sp.]
MNEGNLTKRQAQAIETKKQILETSMKLISEYGYDNVKISQICKEVGISVGGFYHHFKSKEDIIIEVYKEFDFLLENYINNNLNEECYIDKIISIILYQVSYAKKKGVDILKQVYKAQLYEGTEFFISDERKLSQILKNTIQCGQDNNEIIKEFTATQIKDQLLRFSRGILYDWCIHNGDYDLLNETYISINLLLNTMKNK